MVRKLILRAGPEADFTVYLAPEDQSGFYYNIQKQHSGIL